MNRPILLSALMLLTACLPATSPLVTGRADNAMMRFSAVGLTATTKADFR